MAELILDFFQNEESYTDGIAIEDEIFSIVKNNIFENFDNIKNINWPIFYHLSPLRENILNWYPFKSDVAILELGAGCGAITGLLCNKAKSVASVELTKKRACINYERHKQHQNLKVFVGNLESMSFQSKFDYIIINGVLEYAGGFISDGNPYRQFLRKAASFLKEDGVILLAIENRLGLKYFSGAKEDHLGKLFAGLDGYPGNSTVRTFSKSELINLIHESGLVIGKFYYPYPDYKFPEVIYSDKGFSKVPLSYDPRSYDIDRYLFFNEIQMQRLLVKEMVESTFANSFLVEIRKNTVDNNLNKNDILYVKLNTNRDNAFKICTIIFEQDKKVKVKKQALMPQAIKHLEKMSVFFNKHKQQYTELFTLLPVKISENQLVYDYLDISTFESILLDKKAAKDPKGFIELLGNFYKLLFYSYKVEKNSYSQEFHSLFGPFKCKEDLEFTAFSNMDILFDNVFYDNNKFIISDYEWCVECKLPVLFIFWRSINEFYIKNVYFSDFFSREDVYHQFNINDDMISIFYKWEGYFSSNYVKMENILRYKKKMIAFSSEDDVFNKNRCIANLYMDRGNGFTDEDKCSQIYLSDLKEISLSFDLDKYKNIQSIRFDPIEGQLCKCKILSATINGKDCKFLAYNKFPFTNDDLFLTIDPIYLIQGTYCFKGKLEICFSIQIIKENDIFSQTIEGIGLELIARQEADEKIKNMFEIQTKHAELAEKHNELLSQFNIITLKYDDLLKELKILSEEKNTLLSACSELELEKSNLTHICNNLINEKNDLMSALNELEVEKNNLTHACNNLKQERDAVALEYEIILNSTIWNITKPLRISLDNLKKSRSQLVNSYREYKKLAGKVRQNVKSYGLKKTVHKIYTKGGECLSNVKEAGEIAEKVQSSNIWEEIELWIDKTPHSFIDIFHVPMGWNTPLFQRFQHLSLQAGRVGGISFYGAHPLVDKDIEICKFATPTLCVVNLDNYEVKKKLFEVLDRKPELKFIRLQSIDLATTIDELESFLSRGYEIVYEYIDELTPQIVGSIPEFVFKRHEYVLQNERITVVATSDKLFDQVKPYRRYNMAMINNGVDYEHWNLDRNQIKCPNDIKEIIDQGKIIIGYHGALAQWIDYDLLKRLADDKRFIILLIGHAHDDILHNSGLLDRNNVYFIGARPYNELGSYAAFYDIGILPFILNNITKSVSPVKIFEYMALGTPVVTYALPECMKYKSCLCANTQEEFIENINKALDLRFDKDYRKNLKDEALENTWQSVMQKTLALVVENHKLYSQPKMDAPPTQNAQQALKGQEFPDITDGVNSEGLQKKTLYMIMKKIYWKIPFLTPNIKNKFLHKAKKMFLPSLQKENELQKNVQDQMITTKFEGADGSAVFSSYISQILSIPDKSKEYVLITEKPYEEKKGHCKVIAYYLTQFHPDRHNEIWWGKGVTEWNNVCRAVPQYVGHYQPRIPGELGFYDLRIRDNMMRQIELAKMYGIYGFSFYYYWFNGERLLEKPLEAFLCDKTLEFPFSLCWANENWTKRFDGTNYDILIEQPKKVESYRNVIHDMIRFLKDDRYIKIKEKKMITVYRPDLMPETQTVLGYWREYCKKQGIGELYIIAVKVNMVDMDLLSLGYDAITEFHPGTLYTNCKNITHSINYIQNNFGGEVFDYCDIVENQKYFKYNLPKLYRSVMPMWDNTARRNNKGMIFHGSTPALYKKWLKDVINEGKSRNDIDDRMVFINAWNEWGEGAYLEPDKRFGYAYLEATKEAVEETGNENGDNVFCKQDLFIGHIR